jgi:hypothetical protein
MPCLLEETRTSHSTDALTRSGQAKRGRCGFTKYMYTTLSERLLPLFDFETKRLQRHLSYLPFARCRHEGVVLGSRPGSVALVSV